jgi:hypothetical protein
VNYDTSYVISVDYYDIDLHVLNGPEGMPVTRRPSLRSSTPSSDVTKLSSPDHTDVNVLSLRRRALLFKVVAISFREASFARIVSSDSRCEAIGLSASRMI